MYFPFNWITVRFNIEYIHLTEKNQQIVEEFVLFDPE